MFIDLDFHALNCISLMNALLGYVTGLVNCEGPPNRKI